MTNSETVVQAQLVAYNQHDIEAYMETFSEAAELYELPENRLTMQGKAAIRAHYTERFRVNPQLRGEVTQTMLFGDYVIYYEKLYGLKSEGAVDIVAIYQVENNLVRRIWFAR